MIQQMSHIVLWNLKYKTRQRHADDQQFSDLGQAHENGKMWWN